jgi:apolipoprotein N-acyltransferase
MRSAARPGSGMARRAWLGWVFATAWLAAPSGGCSFPCTPMAGCRAAGRGRCWGWRPFALLRGGLALGLFSRLSHANKALAAMLFASRCGCWPSWRGARWFTGFPWGAGGYAHVPGRWRPCARGGRVWRRRVAAGLAMAAGQAAGAICALGVPGRWWRWRLLGLPCLGATPCAVELCHTPARQPKAPRSWRCCRAIFRKTKNSSRAAACRLALRWYAEQLRSETASLVVAPETAIPLLPQQLPGYLEGLQERYTQGNQAALLGIPLGNAREGYTNSVLGWRPGQAAPEPLPLRQAPSGALWRIHSRRCSSGSPMMNIPLGDFNRGALGQPSFDGRGSACSPTGTPRAARCCSPTTWKSAPAPATPPPSCAPSAPSPGRPPTCSPAAAPRTAATARTPTACSTTTSTRWCSSPRRPTSWSCTWARSKRWASI